MTGCVVSGPRRGQLAAESFQSVIPLGISQTGWPTPLDTRRGLAPPYRSAACRVLYRNGGAKAGDACECLRSELQGNARLDGEQIEPSAYNTDIVVVIHGRLDL